MQNRSQFMTEDQFWSLIAESKKAGKDQVEKLIQMLVALPLESIIGFDYQLYKLTARAYTSELWCAAYIVCGGCSDDGFDYFKAWLICQGQEVYEAALKNSDSLLNTFEALEEGDYPEREELLGVPYEAYERKTGKSDFYDVVDQYEDDLHFSSNIAFNWEEGSKASMAKICPKLVERYYDNPL